jgi:hypothetical protein
VMMMNLSLNIFCRLMIFALQMEANNPVCSTSHCTLYNDQEDVRHYERIPTGMWRKDYVIAHRFNEDLKKYVDTDFLVRTGKDDRSLCIYSLHGSSDTSTTNITIISVGTNMN